MEMQYKKDLQNSSSKEFGEIILDRVGITNVKKRIQIIWDEYHQYWISSKISALIRLPKNQRGIHMSRSAETIEEAINLMLYSPVHSLEQFAKRVLDKLLESHDYTDHAEITIAGDLILQINDGEGRQGQKPFEITLEAALDKGINGEKKYYGKVGIAAWGMTCCPCAQQMNIEYIQSIFATRTDIKISQEDINKLLHIIPVASHNQRALGKIQIGFKSLDKEIMDVLDLIEIIESSMSGRIHAVLKRPDEAELVRVAHFDPVFVEDAIRRMASKLTQDKFNSINDDTSVQISIISYESIHIHDVYAEINSTFGDLRKSTKI
jgi:GTP cyclohydrolase-4